MDDSLEVLLRDPVLVFLDVSILVLLDDSLEDQAFLRIVWDQLVSILVLLDDSLEG